MKNFIAISCFFISLSSFAGHLGPVKFLEGCWSAWDENGNKVSEIWQTPSTNNMAGLSQTVSSQGEILSQESLNVKWLPKIRAIQYQARINGELMAPFLLDQSQSSISKKAVFINPSNEFPKSISYEISSSTTLTITLAGNDETGASFEIAYELKSELCEKL